jgi:hypothetical protein
MEGFASTPNAFPEEFSSIVKGIVLGGASCQRDIYFGLRSWGKSIVRLLGRSAVT